jgi:hypothetical protein
MKIFKKLQRGQLIILMTVLSVLILTISGGYWWKDIYSTPERVFNRMLANALSTKSVTKYTAETAGDQSITQATRLTVAGSPMAQGISTIKQGSGDQASSVKRETLTTLEKSYLKLVSVETTQLSSSGEPFDFSGVLNVWAENAVTESDNANVQLYGQNVAVPFVDLGLDDRNDILSVIREQAVYEVDFSKAERGTYKSRAVFNYEVGVKPSAFIAMMKTIGDKVNLAGYEDVNPGEYTELPVVSFTFSIDIITGDLLAVESSDGQMEHFSGHGFRSIPRVPSDAITMDDLQKRLNEL